MLKQLFDEQSILKVITGKDIWRWKVLENYKNPEDAAKQIAENWSTHGISISSLTISNIKRKPTFRTQNLEDTLAVKLVDRYIRRIYKVRQSDRSRMVKQLITLLQDPGEFSFIRFDIENCYESIHFSSILSKLKNDLILSPTCIDILEQVNNYCEKAHMIGLPRGLSISTTLAELYLENLDSKLSANEDITYSARYVDDCIVMTPSEQTFTTKAFISDTLEQLNLKENPLKSSTYQANPTGKSIELLGYSLTSNAQSKKANKVTVKISQAKLNKIKSRVMLSFLSYKHSSSSNKFKLFKDRIYFLSTLRVVKKAENGNLLAGNTYNYALSDLNCLRKVDHFYHDILHKNQTLFSITEFSALRKIYFYSNAKNKKFMKITRKRASVLQQAWSSSL